MSPSPSLLLRSHELLAGWLPLAPFPWKPRNPQFLPPCPVRFAEATLTFPVVPAVEFCLPSLSSGRARSLGISLCLEGTLCVEFRARFPPSSCFWDFWSLGSWHLGSPESPLSLPSPGRPVYGLLHMLARQLPRGGRSGTNSGPPNVCPFLGGLLAPQIPAALFAL